jgi:hypothetical protein
MDFLLAGTLDLLCMEFSMPGDCPASLPPSSPVPLWKTFRCKLNAIPEDDKTVRLPTAIAFTFPAECRSESQRNGVQLQTGIAFSFDRIPHC